MAAATVRESGLIVSGRSHALSSRIVDNDHRQSSAGVRPFRRKRDRVLRITKICRQRDSDSEHIDRGPALGPFVLPIMIYHSMQLLVCAWLAKRYARLAPLAPGIRDVGQLESRS